MALTGKRHPFLARYTAGFTQEGRLEGVRGDDGSGKILPNERRIGDGIVKVVSTGNLVDDEGTALMWRGLMLTKAVEQFLRDVQWGDLDYLFIDMPPGTVT
jgi:ATP-binding protein involved in chromosome partitioning